MAGGFLVAAAGVGLFASYLHATSTPHTRYVVARHTLTVGRALQSADIALLPIVLPPGTVAAHAFTRSGSVVGRVVMAPVAGGELVQASALAAVGQGTGGRQVDVAIDAGQVDLAPGSWVDILVTHGSGDTTHTDVVLLHARLLGLNRPHSSIGGGSGSTAELDVPTFADVKALVQAAHGGQLTLVLSGPDTAGAG